MNLIENILLGLYNEYKDKENFGALANYIPQLTKVNPKNLGITVTTVDGHQYVFGDKDIEFTIQSVSKPFIYGMALQECGIDAVKSKIGVEPSGDAFNSISLFPETGQPFNPMINAGAIAATGLIWDIYKDQTFDQILKIFSVYAGQDLVIDNSVFESESETGHRNRAIAHLLRNFNILTSEVEAPLKTYFQQCSINVNCISLSVMGATLANNGINPITNEKVLDEEYIPKVLSVMSTCGMYDYSGEWIYNVGIPAKSGVGGGVLAVLPGQLSVAVYSPLLDAKGNSVFGVEICERIAAKFSLHLYNTPSLTQQVIRKHTTLEVTRSKYKRDKNAEEIFLNHGHDIHIMELQGDLGFATCEIFMRRIPPSCKTLIINLRKCNRIDDAALSLMLELDCEFQKENKAVFLTNYHRLNLISELTHEDFSCLQFDKLEYALIATENALLDEYNYNRSKIPVKLENQQLLQELNDAEIIELSRHLTSKSFKKGDLIIEKGRKAKNIYFLESGEVDIMSVSDDKREFILAVLIAGNSFGEMALIENTVRSANVIAKSEAKCLLLPYNILDENPLLATVKSKILTNIALSLSRRLRLANEEIAGYI